MGTALLGRGLALAHEDAISWTLTHPDEVAAVHRSHVEAGAELLLANTFGARAPTREELQGAVRIARESGARWVAVTLWPGLRKVALGAAARVAADCGADAIWVETAMSAEEAGLALQVARAESSLPVAVSLAFAAFSGAGDLEASAPRQLARLAEQGAAIVGLNCGPWNALSATSLAALARSIAERVAVPFALKPDSGSCATPLWARLGASCVESGARLVGGCCGTDAAHLHALNRALRGDDSPA